MSEELLQYEVLKPISFKGDRIEKGSVIRMTSEEAKNIGEEFLRQVEKTDTETSTEKKDEEEKTDTEEEEKSPEENTEGTQTGNEPEE